MKKTRQQSLSRTSSLELPSCRTFTDSMLNINVREQLNDSGEEQEQSSQDADDEERFYESQEYIEAEDPQEGPSNRMEYDLISTRELVKSLV
ncbi:hypothetical protein AVEN_243579-1 [Araneus ventricosus]|uniref:Uncharacterized protein n=1 Tax=Araneus ventricosus TaxID=182803 RepID=A0A4Y2A575_ARAVE|nr:hypothetical protein AVEN_243579-1 [Araneus ventricosus]